VNLALSSVFIILGVLPGIVFWNSYLSGKFPRQIRGTSPVAELALYVFLAVPINAGALWVIRDDPRALKLDTVLEILIGKAGDNLSQVASLEGSWRFTVVSYLLLIIVCYVAGSLLRRLVWALRLDARFRLLEKKLVLLVLDRHRKSSRATVPCYVTPYSTHSHGLRDRPER